VEKKERKRDRERRKKKEIFNAINFTLN